MRIGGAGALVGLLYIHIHFVGILVGISAYLPTTATDHYVDDTTRQQEIASRWYLFANTTTEKEDEVYPLTVKEITEAQRAHKHYAKYFKDTNKKFKNKDSHISIRLTMRALQKKQP